ncbi:MAG: DM13 domain-containing protein [Anaerolineae bacterium]|nr:DM13 domain-containing protein [Anaerolineae bacterium]
MNSQRWIAVGLLALLVLCLASSGVWLPFFGEDETPTPTPTPGEVVELESAETPTPTLRFELTATAQPTLDPVVVELMRETGLETLGVGDEPFIIMAGDFTVIDSMHRADGTASIYQIGDVKRALRLDPFTVTSGPDLHVILSQDSEPRTSAEALLPTHVDLGPLKGLSGAQNYDIPDDVNLKTFKSVVIYSKSLILVFSSATLEQVRG